MPNDRVFAVLETPGGMYLIHADMDEPSHYRNAQDQLLRALQLGAVCLNTGLTDDELKKRLGN